MLTLIAGIPLDTSLDHLPERQRADLARVVELIRGACDDVAMIILFGSFARGDWKTEADLPPEDQRRSGHPSDYDILVVTHRETTAQNMGLWQDLSRQLRSMGLATHARIIAYDIDSLNERLEKGRYFYTDIVKEGRMLHDSGYVTLATPKPMTVEQRRRIADGYFTSGFKTATMFFSGYEFHREQARTDSDHYRQAAFQLHQATESAYKTVLLVFTGYSPKEHWLHVLGDDASQHVPELADIFPMETDADRMRFGLLDEAYIGARYDPSYSISAEDLDTLARSVRTLLDRVKVACEAELAHRG